DPAVPPLPRPRARAADGAPDDRGVRPAAVGAHRRPPVRPRGAALMLLLVVGCSYRNSPVAVRERLAFTPEQVAAALGDLEARSDSEAVILSTCNRVEVYLARVDKQVAPDVDLIAEFLAEFHRLPAAEVAPQLYHHRNADAVRHLFRVTASLDSMLVGEGQI